jgi:Domain of Unknown Function (DUF1080)
MNRTKIPIVISGAGAAILLAALAWPQQQPGSGGFARGGQPFAYADNEGWISLFDGETLNGWAGDTRYWGVKDGSIYVEPTCEKPTGTIYLVWQGGELSDFMLKFESKGTANVNGGLQYRSYLTAGNDVGLKYPGRGAECSNPGTPPSAAERARFDMAGPQFDFDANNHYSGQYYEQSSMRGIAAPPGEIVLAEPGRRLVLATIADKTTLDSWFHKDDYNQFLLVAKGHTSSMFMNGHLVSVFIDNDPGYFRSSGKIGLEVEGTGAYYTRNIWLKRM